PNAWRRIAPALDRDAARRTLGIPREDFVVGWVGRLSVEKGPDVLLEALPHLNTVPLTISLIGGGTGAEQRALRARADKLGVADHIRWHGVVPDAERVYTAFDVCVLSSRTEGTPVVLFEAMAAGVPVVATAVGGVPMSCQRRKRSWSRRRTRWDWRRGFAMCTRTPTRRRDAPARPAFA